MQFTAVYMQVPEGYIAFVEELPGANTQGATLEEAVAMVIETMRKRPSLAKRRLSNRSFLNLHDIGMDL